MKVYISVSEYGEITQVFSNMKKCYDFLFNEENHEWLDSVNYSYFTRVLNQKDNTRHWKYRRRGSSIVTSVKFLQREVD